MVPGRHMDCGIKQTDIKSYPFSARTLHQLPAHSKSKLHQWPLRSSLSLYHCPLATQAIFLTHLLLLLTQLQPQWLPGWLWGLRTFVPAGLPAENTLSPDPTWHFTFYRCLLKDDLFVRPSRTAHFRIAPSPPPAPSLVLFPAVLSCTALTNLLTHCGFDLCICFLSLGC